MPQKIRPMRIVTGWSPSDLPMSLGSTTLPIRNCTTAGAAIATRGTFTSGLNRIRGIGSTMATIDPMFGMKFSRKENIAQIRARGTLHRVRMM